MVEVRQSESAGNGQDTYIGLNAFEVYKQLLDDDMKRLVRSADSLLSRQDRDADGFLNSQELRSGIFPGKYDNDADKTYSRFLLQNYSAVAGLSRAYCDSAAPISGISSKDIDALRCLASPDLRDAFIEGQRREAYKYGNVALNGALVGGGIGLGASAVMFGVYNFVPAKMRAPLTLAALGAPVLGACIGAPWGMKQHLDSANKFLLEKEARVNEVLSKNMATMTAKPTYDGIVQSRFARLMSQFGEAPDVDGNAHVDKTEVSLALQHNSGNKDLNTFLNDNYNELELISRSYSNMNLERGINLTAVGKLFDDGTRDEYLAHERNGAKDLGHYRFAVGLPKGLVIGAPLCGAIAYASKYLPARYQSAGFIGFGLSLYIIPLLSGALDQGHTMSRTDKFFQDQNDALERIRRRI